MQKKLKEKEKKLLRKEKARLRGVAAGVVAKDESGVSDDDVEKLCTSLEISLLRGLCEKLEGICEVEEQAEYLRKVIRGAERIISSDSAASGTPVRVDSSSSISSLDATTSKTQDKCGVEVLGEKGKKTTTSVTEERPWSKQEVDLLRKAVQKFPKGTSQRWEVVANYIGTNRSVEEILRGVKTVLLQKPDSSKAFDSFLQKRKTRNVVIDSPLSTREDGVGNVNSGELHGTKVAGNGTVGGEKIHESNSKQTTAAEQLAGGMKSENGAEPTKASLQSVQSNGAAAHGAAAEVEGWSEAQEVALVKAIKAFPKDTVNRWDRIATAVPGKSKAQCFKKFAELRDSFRNTKKAD